MSWNRNKTIVLVFVLQLIFLISIAVYTNMILAVGDSVTVKMDGYDPYDPLRGRYVILQMDQRIIPVLSSDISKVESMDSFPDKMYIVMQDPNSGYFDYATLTKPKNGEVYIQTEVRQSYNLDVLSVYINSTYIYYMNEQTAIEVDKIIGSWVDGEKVEVYMNLKVMNGNFQIDYITVDGITY